eukprot:CAMPEP_0198649402 /NCGR_PEP_ID=MMETSP1467-20131203/4244_1 /TAXON_ID=1462469 /ORGANISM="unid. sp., Strain CCMP2135" /LENGTH=189 /DNA_ID=CAMNT_0044385187 /DNA_START=86 /DNA_END=655 /DNA_ORIENTATION=-
MTMTVAVREEEAERARRVAEDTLEWRKPALRELCAAIPKNLVQCDPQLTAVGAFAVGPQAVSFSKRPPTVAAMERERARRVQVYGTGAVKVPVPDLPRNMISCDLALSAIGVYATSVVVKESGIGAALKEEHDHEDTVVVETTVETTNLTTTKKARSSNDFFALLSTSPTSVTASSSVGDLCAIAAAFE